MKFKYWWEDWWPVIVCGVVLLLLLVLQAIGEGRLRDEFMTECLKDRKQYECTAMWRAGESHYVAMPIVIPSGR